jgi:general secretion pathway protein F
LAEAEGIVRGKGFDVLSIESQEPRLWNIGSHRRQTFNLTLFSQELLSLLDAGITVVDALDTLLEKEQRPDARQILSATLVSLREGQTLSSALQRVPEAFPPLFVATIKSSERTSDLANGLRRYIKYASQIDQVRSKLVSASIYPVLLIGSGALVIAFLLGYVVPRFGRIYADLGSNLPFMSRALLHWGNLVEHHGMLMLAALISGAIALWKVLSLESVRRHLIERIWAMPALGNRLQIYQLARFYRTLGMLLRGGIPVASALDMVAGLLQPAYRSHLTAATASIREGRSISEALSTNNLTTAVAVRMLRVGERSGQMGEMMERTASFYDAEFTRWVEWFTRLFEPLLMAFIGLIIGAIVVLMYLPIFELAGSLR